MTYQRAFTLATTRANSDSVRRVRGFSRGHGKNSLSQERIDTMFHAQRSTTGGDDASAQTDITSLADGNDSDDSDTPFDDTTDT